MNLDTLIKKKWPVLLASWSLFGVVMAVQSYVLSARVGHPIPFALALQRELIYAYLWAILTPYILLLARRFPFGPTIWLRHGLFHIFMGIAVAIFHKFMYHLITINLEATAANPFSMERIYQNVLSYIDYGAMIYFTMLFLDYSVSYYRQSREHALRSAKLEKDLIQANLQALKMQIRPHFLFNTLNAISVLIQKNPEAARQMILRLSELLRMTLDREHTEEITLAQELELLDRYLQIEKTRFEERLIVKMIIDESMNDARVPTMILQPLVENAMRHGMAMQRDSTMIEISAGRQNGYLNLSVRDNGPGRPETESKDGIGFSNIRSRLEQLYGRNHRFETGNAPGGGFCATISLPFHTGTDQSFNNQ